MWTQRDQLQAYQFLRRRLVSALQAGDANHAVPPSRRLILGCAFGVAGTLLLSAGFAVLGMLRPGANPNWRGAGQVVIEEETGASFVVGGDGLLHPALNYTSALLLAGGAGRGPITVAAGTLSGMGRGVPAGIPGAPASPPVAGALLRGPWTACVQPGTPPATVAIVGTAPSTGDRGVTLVVRDGAADRYLLSAGRRWRVRDPAVLVALGADGAPPIAVSHAWLDAVPAGPDLTLLAVPRPGRPGPRVAGTATRVGQVLVVSTVGSGDRYYIVEADGLAPAGRTAAALILGNPADRPAYRGVPQAIRVSAADVAAAPASKAQPARDLPALAAAPVAVAGGQALCVVPGGDVWVAPGLPLPPGARPVPAGGPPAADRIFVPPGHGALVLDPAAPGTGYLITDQGIRYPLGGPDAAKALGYGSVAPAPLPRAVLALFPLGPRLDMRAASRSTGLR
jgi:type VII secretion protein EccB